jgi:hypothetical protein
MSNCFGLKLLYSYLNLPFLALKKANMLQALKMIDSEAAAAGDEMERLVSGSPYEGYVEHLSRTKATVRVPRPRASKGDGDAAAKNISGKKSEYLSRADAQPAQVGSEEEPASAAPENEVNAPTDKKQSSAPPAEEEKPRAPQPTGGVDDEMSLLNERALKGSAMSSFFEDDEDPSPEPTDAAAANAGSSPTRAAAPSTAQERGGKVAGSAVGDNSDNDDIPGTLASKQNASDDSSDDEFYSQPRFGISAVAVPPPPAPRPPPPPSPPSPPPPPLVKQKEEPAGASGKGTELAESTGEGAPVKEAVPPRDDEAVDLTPLAEAGVADAAWLNDESDDEDAGVALPTVDAAEAPKADAPAGNAAPPDAVGLPVAGAATATPPLDDRSPDTPASFLSDEPMSAPQKVSRCCAVNASALVCRLV